VAAFAEMEQYPLVVKPIESAGADGFKLCHSFDEAWEGGVCSGVAFGEPADLVADTRLETTLSS